MLNINFYVRFCFININLNVKSYSLQVAIADIVEACRDADVLVFVLPHQFMPNICRQLHGHVKPTAIGVSLIKVTHFN